MSDFNYKWGFYIALGFAAYYLAAYWTQRYYFNKLLKVNDDLFKIVTKYEDMLIKIIDKERNRITKELILM